ncbi:MAG: carboxypeptidase-like regulatory domain-containing protein [Bacteroidota bacterium]
MKNYIFYLFVSLLFFSCESNNRETKNIDADVATTDAVTTDVQLKINVVDENKEPLPGATIIVEDTEYGATSDFDGNATLSIPYSKDHKEVNLQVSYIGFEPKTETVALNSSSESITVILKE